jgi:hypothetical protein
MYKLGLESGDCNGGMNFDNYGKWLKKPKHPIWFWQFTMLYYNM